MSSEDYSPKNLCVSCGMDMGEGNPRQFCRKTYCDNPPDETPEPPKKPLKIKKETPLQRTFSFTKKKK